MSDLPNANLVMRGFEAFASGDMETMTEILAPDIKWHAAGNNILSGDYEGLESVLALFGRVGQETQGSFSNEVHAILADDEHAVALVNTSATRGDKTLEGRGVFVYHISGGRATEVWLLTMDQAAADDFWS